MDKNSRKFNLTTGAYKTILCKKLFKYKLYGVTKNTKKWITEIELLRRDILKTDLHIDDQ